MNIKELNGMSLKDILGELLSVSSHIKDQVYLQNNLIFDFFPEESNFRKEFSRESKRINLRNSSIISSPVYGRLISPLFVLKPIITEARFQVIDISCKTENAEECPILELKIKHLFMPEILILAKQINETRLDSNKFTSKYRFNKNGKRNLR